MYILILLNIWILFFKDGVCFFFFLWDGEWYDSFYGDVIFNSIFSIVIGWVYIVYN